MEDFLDESFRQFILESKSDWEGLTYEEYIAYLLFFDALADLLAEEDPALAEKMDLDVSRPMYKILKKFFQKRGLVITDYIDWRSADVIEKSIDKQLNGKMSLNYLAKWNSKFLKTIVNNTLGRGSISDDTDLMAMFKNQRIAVPDVAHLGTKAQERSFNLAAKAISKLKTADSTLSESIDYAAMNARRTAIKSVLKLSEHFPDDIELEYIVAYLENLK